MPVGNKKNHCTKKVKRKNVDETNPMHDKELCLDKLEISHNIQKKSGTIRNKTGGKRVYSPFNRFARNNSPNKRNYDKAERTTYKSIRRSPGLSSKDKSYIISSCQSKSSRYLKLKELAAKAKKENKIFSIYGTCNALRKALLQRGWVEKIPPNKMNLAKIHNGIISSKSEISGELEKLLLSNLVEKCNPNFVWRDRQNDYDTTIDMKKECFTIVNKLKMDALWTSKQGLCTSMKINYWFYIEDVADVNCPRTYNTFDNGEIDEFIADYRITACTNLLKWILYMEESKKFVFTDRGTVSMKVMAFALNRCKEYLFHKKNRDIDQQTKNISTAQWNTFLKKYYHLITNDELFEADKENKLGLYLSYAQVLLEEIYKYRPQIRCEGYHNIWIIKPGHCSRGRGIRMASKLGVITNLLNKANAKYVIQKYIEKPLLIHETKFDIRQYYLVTSTYPLVIWMYRDCYLKFSSQRYDLENYHESIHLTNNAVQRKYNNHSSRDSELPEHNMWELSTYKNYLKKIGADRVWDHIIYSGMRKSIVGIMLSCQDTLPVCKNRFELYGCDFILDEDYTPWLLEINSCPDLNKTTDVTATICPAVLDDLVKDYMADPNATTGNFECIYRQPMTIPRFSSCTDLVVQGKALPNDYFYKGDIITTPDQHAYLNDKDDIEAMLDKIKLFYCEEVILDESSHDQSVNERVSHPDRANIDSTVLLNRNTIFNKYEQQQKLKQIKLPAKVITSEYSNNQSTGSLTNVDINLLLKNFEKRFGTETFLRAQKQLVKKLDCEQFSTMLQKYAQSSPKPSNKKLKDYVIQATSEIISFINAKEEEYYANLQNNTMKSTASTHHTKMWYKI